MRARVRRFVGAIVGGGFFAGDVLLARLKGQDKAAAALLVDVFANQAACHAAKIFVLAGKDAEVGTAIAEGVAQ